MSPFLRCSFRGEGGRIFKREREILEISKDHGFLSSKLGIRLPLQVRHDILLGFENIGFITRLTIEH